MKIALSLFFSVCCVANLAVAEVVIDDFTGNDQSATNFIVINNTQVALNDDVAGTRDFVVNNNLNTSQILSPFVGNNLAVQSVNNLSVLTIGYTFTSPLNITASIPTLVFDLFETVTGTWTATFSLNSGAVTTGPVAVTSGSAIGWNPGPVAVNDISIVLAQSDVGGGAITHTSASVIANPEPASLALLGMTGLIGGVVVRRRRKAAESV